MTGGAIGPRGPRGKLILMYVLMAIAAQFMRHRPLKIVVLVALRAHQLRMFAVQRKVGGLVIE